MAAFLASQPSSHAAGRPLISHLVKVSVGGRVGVRVRGWGWGWGWGEGKGWGWGEGEGWGWGEDEG
jgi:hypothetical protein